MHPRAAISHTTAAQLWNVPFPLAESNSRVVHVSIATPDRAPRGRGVIGHRLSAMDVVVRHGVRVTFPATTWCSLASVLGVYDLVAAADYLLTGDPYNNVLPLVTLEELQPEVAAHAGTAGHRSRARSVALAREGPLSRPESLARLVLVAAGVPHPQINLSITDGRGSFIAMPDLTWPDFAVALEYEGDHHRGVLRFRKDISRIERLVDHGWLVVKASASDLFDGPDELVGRVVRRLQSRGWRPGRIRLPHNVQFTR